MGPQILDLPVLPAEPTGLATAVHDNPAYRAFPAAARCRAAALRRQSVTGRVTGQTFRCGLAKSASYPAWCPTTRSTSPSSTARRHPGLQPAPSSDGHSIPYDYMDLSATG